MCRWTWHRGNPSFLLTAPLMLMPIPISPSLPLSRFPRSGIFFSRVLGSVSCPTIRSPGKDRTPDDHASLLGATVSLQCGQDYNVPAPVDPPLCPPRGEGRSSPLRTDPTKILGNTSVKGGVPSSNSENNHKGDSKSTSDCSSGQFRLFSATGAEKCSTEVCMQACVQSESDGCASAHESRGGEYTAVLSVKERELRGHSVLYMRVSSTMKKKKLVFVSCFLPRRKSRFSWSCY